MILQDKITATPEQIEYKLNKGVHVAELQLLPDDTIESVIDTLAKYPTLKINTVHTVNFESKNTINLNHLSKYNSLNRFYKACLVANKLAAIQGTKVGVVLHNTFTAADYESASILFNSIVSTLKSTQLMYGGIYFLIENTEPLSEDMRFRNGILADDTGVIVKRLTNAGVTNIGIMLDLKHLSETFKFFKQIKSDADFNKLTLKYWLKKYGSLIKNIHLSSDIDMEMLDDSYDNLNNSDSEILHKLKMLCEEYNPDVIWTADLKESDLASAEIKNILERLN